MITLPEIKFTGYVWQWRGPAPFYFVTVPDAESADIKAVSKLITYGWGMIPAVIKIGATSCKTSLFFKDGNYVVPLKAELRKKEQLVAGDKISLCLKVGPDSN